MTSDLIARIEAALSDEHPLTGLACKHGWDTAVCPMVECGNPYAMEPLLRQAADHIAELEKEVGERDGWQAAAHDVGDKCAGWIKRAEAAEALLEEAKAVIEPFAVAAEAMTTQPMTGAPYPDDERIFHHSFPVEMLGTASVSAPAGSYFLTLCAEFTASDFRKARAFLSRLGRGEMSPSQTSPDARPSTRPEGLSSTGGGEP